MDLKKWLIVAAFLIGVTYAWNGFWDNVIRLMESGASIAPMMNVMSLAIGVLTLGIIIAALVIQARPGNTRPSRKWELLGFFAIQLIAAIVCYLLWLWIRIPEEAGSPALSVMSVFGWGVVAMPTWFGIGIVGLHYLSRMQRS